MAVRRSTSRLNKVDLPTLGRPTIATMFDTENLRFDSAKDTSIIYLEDKHEKVKPRFLDTIQRAYSDALSLDKDIEKFKAVIFSDHHRGQGDRADDYRLCSHTYDTAIDHYYSNRYSLFLLGDVEELWECSAGNVLDYYKEITAKEMAFEKQGLYRIWGNHDADWSRKKMVSRYLPSPGAVHEAITIRISDGGRLLGKLFLVHGHQGTWFSDEFARMGKFFVRYFWRPFQNITQKSLTTAANNTYMRSKHDEQYYRWALEHNHDLIVITGHTHEPVFNSFTYADRLRLASARLENVMQNNDLTAVQRKNMEEINQRISMLKGHNATHLNPKGHAVPCYFNTGCCSYGDGGITGIEIADGMIRLVKWDTPGERRVIHESRLRRIFRLLELNSTLESEGI